MIEMILMIAVLAVAVMSWSKVSKAMDWAGVQIGNTTDMLEDVTKAGSLQTKRAVVISNNGLKDTIQESVQKSATRADEYEKFTSKLSTESKKKVTDYEKELEALLKNS